MHNILDYLKLLIIHGVVLVTLVKEQQLVNGIQLKWNIYMMHLQYILLVKQLINGGDDNDGINGELDQSINIKTS